MVGSEDGKAIRTARMARKAARTVRVGRTVGGLAGKQAMMAFRLASNDGIQIGKQ